LFVSHEKQPTLTLNRQEPLGCTNQSVCPLSGARHSTAPPGCRQAHILPDGLLLSHCHKRVISPERPWQRQIGGELANSACPTETARHGFSQRMAAHPPALTDI